jgi:2-hydroxy-3-keto-5-methylthiopentenyl-1-phosphate phosphatase
MYMKTDPQNKPLAVLVDFDETITKQDIGDQVVTRFAEPGWNVELDRFRMGEINVKEFGDLITNCLRENREVASVKHAPEVAEIRPGFETFLKYCKLHEIHVEVVSSGMSFYVDEFSTSSGWAIFLGHARLSTTTRTATESLSCLQEFATVGQP